MSDPNVIRKIVRKARKLYGRAQDENASPRARVEANFKAKNLEMELATLLFDPHMVSNAEIEVRRLKALLARKSTDASNRDKRKRKLHAAELALNGAMAFSAELEANARKILDNLMGRPDQEAEKAKEKGASEEKASATRRARRKTVPADEVP